MNQLEPSFLANENIVLFTFSSSSPYIKELDGLWRMTEKGKIIVLGTWADFEYFSRKSTANAFYYYLEMKDFHKFSDSFNSLPDRYEGCIRYLEEIGGIDMNHVLYEDGYYHFDVTISNEVVNAIAKIG